MAAKNTGGNARSARKGTLNRERILQAALTVVDAEGADALTMRRIATELGVDPMAIYRHVESKDALLNGVVEALWRQIPQPPRRSDTWAEQLRDFAYALRATVNVHPGAAPLLLTRRVVSVPALEAFDVLLRNLRDAGFDEPDAAQTLRAVTSTALGDALTALAYQALLHTPAPTTASAETEKAGESEEADAWITLTQALPPGTSPHLVRTAYTVCTCEPDADFTFILDLILDGARKLKRHPDPASA